MNIIIPIIIGIAASFIAWIIPAELLIPRISAMRYSEEKEVVKNKTKETEEEIEYLTRKILVKNKSFLYSAYNISYSFEFYNSDDTIVYSESWTFPHLKRGEKRAMPLKAIKLDDLNSKKVVGFSLSIICENRYGTKKKSGPYKMSEYRIDKKSYQLDD